MIFMNRRSRVRYIRCLSKLCKTKRVAKNKKDNNLEAETGRKIEQLQRKAEEWGMSKLKVVNYQQMHSHRELFLQLSKRYAVIIRNGPVVSYQNPQKVRVVIHNPKMDQSEEEDDKTIPFEREDQHNTKLSEISYEQFINYKGYLELSIAQMSLREQTTMLPEYVREYFEQKKRGLSFSSIESVNLWYYKKEKNTTMHYDGHDNFLFVLQGKKVVFLKPPNKVSYSHDQAAIKPKNVFDENANHALDGSFQSLGKVRGLSYGVVSGGECLFIPRGWWHYVHSFGQPCVGVNVWGNSIRKQAAREEEEMLLKYLMFELGQRLGKQMELWNIFSEEHKAGCREGLFNLYLNSLR